MQPEIDTLVNFGSEIKALGVEDAPDGARHGRIGGHLVVWGHAGATDAAGDYFTAKSYLGARDGDGADTMIHHGLPLKVGGVPVKGLEWTSDKFLPPLKTHRDDVGLFAETVCDMADEYEAKIYDLVQQGKLKWSSGAAAHTVRRRGGVKAGEILRWPISEGSLTPTPMQISGTQVMALKSFLELNDAPDEATKTALDGLLSSVAARWLNDSELKFDPSQPRDDAGKWTIIGGHRVSITGNDVSREDVAAAADKYGIGESGKAALLAAHQSGKIKTDDHLLRTIAHATDAKAQHHGDFAAATNVHGVGGTHEGQHHRADFATGGESAAKAPHEMTQQEYTQGAYQGRLDAYDRHKDAPQNKIAKQQFESYDKEYREKVNEHRGKIEDALKEGKSVSPEVLKDYPDLQSAAAPSPSDAQKQREAQVLSHLQAHSGLHHVDDIAKATGLEPAAVNAALVMHDLSGAVQRLPGGMFQATTATPSPAPSKIKVATPYGDKEVDASQVQVEPEAHTKVRAALSDTPQRDWEIGDKAGVGGGTAGGVLHDLAVQGHAKRVWHEGGSSYVATEQGKALQQGGHYWHGAVGQAMEVPKSAAPDSAAAQIEQNKEDRPTFRATEYSDMSSGGKQPWEMTSAEWQDEFDKVRPNAQGTGGGGYRTNIGSSVRGAERAGQHMQDRIKWLKTGLKDANVHGMQIPARHRHVVEYALSQGKSVPVHVLAEYQDLQRGERWGAYKSISLDDLDTLELELLEQGQLAGSRFVDHSARVLAACGEYQERVADLFSERASNRKAGAVISRTNHDRLSAYHSSLQEMCDGLRDLLETYSPDKADDEPDEMKLLQAQAQSAYLDYQAMLMRWNGLLDPVPTT